MTMEVTKRSEQTPEGRCLVVGAGDLTVTGVETREEDLVIAVDGGLSYCVVLELEPDYLVGDFDSVSQTERQAVEELKRTIPERVIELRQEKDDTDMLAALRFGLEKGYKVFHLYGATGGRLEHTIANIQCLLFLKENGAVGYIMDGSSMIFVMKNEEIRFQKSMKGYLSLFSMGREAGGVNITGMKYPLKDYTMRNDYPIGISNEFIGEEASVSVKDGQLLGVIRYQEPQLEL